MAALGTDAACLAVRTTGGADEGTGEVAAACTYDAGVPRDGLSSPGRVCHYVLISTERAQRYIRS